MYQPAGSLSVFMILGQMGTALTAWLAFEYEWKYVYYFMMGILLLSILILFITMPNHGFAGRFPINFRKFGNVTAFCISLTCITYVLVYGKVLDWYDDPSICWATAISILLPGFFFIWMLPGGLPTLFWGVEAAYHSYGGFALFIADDHQFQRDVCQCVCRSQDAPG